jgi:glycosyltransferase involved in cell wall biosynthesis
MPKEHDGRSILFISALDFKEKSIQVIRKTPEAYVQAGWDVRYIVARDTTNRGNYFYENEINLPGMDVERVNWPLQRLRDVAQGRWLLYAITRLAGLLVVLQLAMRAARSFRSEPADVIYGYEMHGVLAARLMRFLGVGRKAKFVTRFQGTWLMDILEKKQWMRFCANIDQIIALRSECDLAIMTDDGTRGDQALRRLGSPALPKLCFWVNGTDTPSTILDKWAIRAALDIPACMTMLVSVSRLEKWKRIDRGIELAARLHHSGAKVAYVVVGEGTEGMQLRKAASDAGVADQIKFVGGVPQQEVFNYLNAADFFVSMYDLSNVGNPLLEAIRLRKIIVTLNNGDTGRWIQHGANGLIYDVTADLIPNASNDILRAVEDKAWRKNLLEGVDTLARERLWTWKERLEEEVSHVEQLIHS